MLKRIKERIRREHFLTSGLGVLTSSIYIVRKGLYTSILRLAPKIEGNVLDFGCGSKPYESLFTNAKSYVGVDIKISGHDHKDSKVDFYYDGKTLLFPDNHFDSIVSFEVFEHIFNLDTVLTELRRVLKPGGHIIITIPFAWEEHEIPYDFARYTTYGIKHIFEKNKFDVLEIIKTTTYILTISQIFISYLAQYVSPKGPILGRVFQFFVIFPITTIALLINFLLPKRYEYFCNSVILCSKK